ncbi:MAG: leucine-rich repeat domain-containing protein, partial [Clostridia bacterium]|nr:leucine-rich repeat domain-containing protein [Clostridia bacterium]
CGDEIQASVGLSYTLLENDTYMVSGIGTCEDETIIIPAIYNGKTITVIGEQAFMDCSDIIGVYIYAPITEIQYCAFSGCAGLRTIKIPATVTKLFEGAFSACENLDSVYLDDFAKWCEIEYCCPDGYWYESGVPDASPLPFAKRLYIDNVYTNHLVIPEGITTIDKEMFSGCSFLSAITIPSTVNYMSFDAFSGCNKLKDVYITDLEKWFEIQFSPYSWSNSECESNPLFNDGRLYLNGELVEHLEIPSSVTSIPSKVFNGCQSIKSVFIHKGVEEIGVNSFMRCSNLESVVFEEGGCLTNIDIYAFDGCYNLSEFNIPPTVTAIHEHAFDGCGELRFELPESLTYLGVGALPYDMYETYEGCNYVGNWLVSGYSGSNSSVTIKEGTVGIAEKAFGGYDSSFTSVTIPSSVKYICREAFSELQTLENVVFEEGSTLHAISPYAFQNCINLKNVALPESITEIGYSVFSGCISLETITLPKSVESIGSNSFYGCDALVAIYWETEYDWVGRRWADDVIYFGKEELWDEDALADYMTNLFCEYSWEKS